MSLREQLLTAATVAPIAPLDITDDLRVWIRPMSSAVRDRLEAAVSRASKDDTAQSVADARWGVILHCCVDETGSPLLTRNDKDAVAGWNSATREAIFEAALKASKVSEAELKELSGN